MIDCRVPVTLIAAWGAAPTAELVDRLARVGPRPVGVVSAAPTMPTRAAEFIEVAEPELVERGRGCRLCAVRYDLIRVLGNLAVPRRRPQWIVAELGAGADPVLAAQTMFDDFTLRHLTRLDGILTVVDGPAASVRAATGQPAWPSSLAAAQPAVADHVIVAGAPRMTVPARDALTELIRASNPLAGITDLEAVDSASSLHRLGGFSPAAAAAIENWDEGPAELTSPPVRPVVLQVSGDADLVQFTAWHRELVHHGRLGRLRGVLSVAGDDRRWLCHAIGTGLDYSIGRRWTTPARFTRLVLTGPDLDADSPQGSLAGCVVG